MTEDVTEPTLEEKFDALSADFDKLLGLVVNYSANPTALGREAKALIAKRKESAAELVPAEAAPTSDGAATVGATDKPDGD